MAVTNLSRIRDLYSNIYSETPEALQLVPMKVSQPESEVTAPKSSAEDQKLAEMQQRDRSVRSRVEGVLAGLGIQVKGSPVYELISGSDSRFYIKDGKITVQVDGITVSASPEAIMGKIQDIRRILKKGGTGDLPQLPGAKNSPAAESQKNPSQPKTYVREYELAMQPLMNYSSQGSKTRPPATPLLFDQMF